MIIGGRNFDDNKTYAAGILNVTPDSFSDGGKYYKSSSVNGNVSVTVNTNNSCGCSTVPSAGGNGNILVNNNVGMPDVELCLRRVEQMISEGAGLIDIGGESTRPGHTQISDEEEIERVAPVVEAVTSRFDITVSVDTYKTRVAEAAIAAGAHMINDIWGLQYDSNLASVIKNHDVSVVLTHNKPSGDYSDFASDYLTEMGKIIDAALTAGIKSEKIIIDPGIGFAKNTEQNLIVMKNLQDFVKINYPVMLGASRKSFIGNTLNLPTDERLEGTLATTALAVMSGVRFVRVHDIKENVRVIRMLEGIYGI